jgi:hypothetical protein
MSEFEAFAREKGLKAINGVVYFEQDSAAAHEFQIEAEKAGFGVIRKFKQHGVYVDENDLSKLPKYWYVRLWSES